MTVLTKKLSYNLVVLFVCLVALIFSTCEKVPDFCGDPGSWYDPNIQFCFGPKPFYRCAGNEFDPRTQGCDPEKNEVGTLCLGETFVPPGTPCAGFTIHTASAPSDGGTIGRTISGPNYDAGSQVTLTAEYAEGYRFIGWTGVLESTNAAVTLTMNRSLPHNMSLVAMFEPISVNGEHRLATTAFPAHGGTITRNPDTPYYSAGTQVTVTATAAAGFVFSGWSGASTSTSSSVTVTMDGSKTLVAMFTPIVYTLTVSSNPTTGGTVFIDGTALTGAAPQDAGTQVIAFAQPAEGYAFSGWTGSGAETRTEHQITVDITSSDQTLTANFRQSKGETEHTHQWGIWDTTAVATCEAPGARTRTCTHDNSHTESEVIPQLSGEACEVDTLCGATNWNWEECIGSLVDDRDDKEYRTTKIGTQTWMAENLNFDASGSVCNENNESNCNTYGRLYDWNTVMDGSPSSSSSPSGVRGICPSGWHVPSFEEWMTLVNYAGVDPGTKLKSTAGWHDNGNGTDDFGFAALPGASQAATGTFGTIPYYGVWWSATESGSDAQRLLMQFNNSSVQRELLSKVAKLSLRCVEDVRP